MATKGTVKIDNVVCNVTKLMEEKGKGNYTSLQGYTISSSYVHMIVMLSNTDTTAVLARGEGQNTVSSLTISDSKFLKHGNDCAFNKNFFIAQGGGEANTTVKCFNSSFSLLGQYNYMPMSGKTPLSTISCIAYITGNYFFLGSGQKYAVCSLNQNNNEFQEVSRVTISDETLNDLKRTGCDDPISQGIYYAKNKLYKVYSYRDKNNNKIVQNNIAVFDLPGTSPQFSGKVSLSAVYACDRTNKEAFEIESISSPDNGSTFYMATNQMENSTTQKDCIYKIKLS